MSEKILFFTSGGIKGVAFIGVLQALKYKNMINDFNTIVGTSIGSIVASLFASKFEPEEMLQCFIKLDLSKLVNINIFDMFDDYGLNDGNHIEKIMENLMYYKHKKKNITLKELYEKTKIKLIITTTNLSTKKSEFLSYETYPDLTVSKAVRMSSSIPIYFTPVNHNGNYYIDGACSANYPTHLFELTEDNFMGIYISNINEKNIKIKNFIDVILNTLQCVSEDHFFKDNEILKKNTLILNPVINPVDFDINKKQAMSLYREGFSKTLKFINSKN